MSKLVSSATLSLLLSSALWGAADDATDRVDAIFSEWDRTDSPGCALGVIRNGELIYENAYGMANLEHGVPLSSRSVFRVGSVSKQFAAFAMLLAEQQGKLSLEDDVRRYVPELPETSERITIRHLIHHSSGIRDYLTLMWLAGQRDEDWYTEDDVVDALARQENTNFTPGSEYLYSNAGYFLLSEIIERATGLSLDTFSQEYIFEPLGMGETHFHDDFRRIVPGRADGYRERADGGFEKSMTTLNMVGDGGIFTTVNDLRAWDRNFYTGEVGGRELAEARVIRGRLTDGTVQDYAAGLRVWTYRGLKVVSHGGSFVGYRAAMLQFPDERFSTYVLCNLADTQPSEMALRVADVFLDAELGDVEAAVRDMPAAASDLVGAYWNEDTGEFVEITLGDGALLWGDSKRRAVPVDGLRFQHRRDDELFELSFDPAEESMTVSDFGQRAFTYRRVVPPSPSVEELARYIGHYRCSELGVTYRVELGDDASLVLETPTENAPLKPMMKDGFDWGSGSVVFERDARGGIEGFELAAGRARNFFFERL